MSASSNHLENKLLDHVLRGGASDYANPGNVFLALFSGTASDVLNPTCSRHKFYTLWPFNNDFLETFLASKNMTKIKRCLAAKS